MKKASLHPQRIWHWTNALLMIALIITGAYLRLRGIAALKSHDPFLTWHKYMGVAMIITTLCWFVYLKLSGNSRRYYDIARRYLNAIRVRLLFHLYAIFAGRENRFKASAHAQRIPLPKIANDGVMFIFLPLQCLTGLFFFNLPGVRRYLLSANLMGLLAAVHLICAYVMVMYLIVHLYLKYRT